MTIRISLGTVLAALALVAIGAGSAVGVMLWEPWDGDADGEEIAVEASPTAAPPEPTPTPYQRRLTGPEASEIVRLEVVSNNPAITEPLILFSVECEATDFNNQLLAWIVECKVTSQPQSAGSTGFTFPETYRLYDATEKIERVGR